MVQRCQIGFAAVGSFTLIDGGLAPHLKPELPTTRGTHEHKRRRAAARPHAPARA